jgi:RNA polymerase sigma-70 factor (ECF subfamily)
MMTDSNPMHLALGAEARAVDPLQDLWARAREGDRASTRRLLEQVGPPVFKVCAAVLGPNHRDLDDAVQNSMVAFLHALRSFRGDCGIRYFATRVAMRTAAYASRRSRKGDARTEALDDEPVTPEQAATRRAALMKILLEELPDAQAEALVLRVVLEYSLQEAADTMQVPINTVRSRVRLAREALRERILSDPALAELREVP